MNWHLLLPVLLLSAKHSSLEITHHNYIREKMCSAVFSLHGNPQSTLGFVLRHLRKLEEVKQEQPYDIFAAYAVQTLYRQSSMIQFEPPGRERTVVQRRALDTSNRPYLKWISKAPFMG